MFAAGGAAGRGELLTLHRSNLSFSALSSPPNQTQLSTANLECLPPSTFHHSPIVSSTTPRPILSLIFTRTPSCSNLGSDEMLKRLPRHLAVLLLLSLCPLSARSATRGQSFLFSPHSATHRSIPDLGMFRHFLSAPETPVL